MQTSEELSGPDLDAAIDFELDKSSVLRDKVRGAFGDLSLTFALYEAFNASAQSGEQPNLKFSDYLRSQGVHVEQGEDELKDGRDSEHVLSLPVEAVGVALAVDSNRIDANPHAFEKQRSLSPVRPATTVAATGHLSVSKLLERLKDNGKSTSNF